ncbi:hypothetical protein BATDEDRAFT_27474 [Batrachochytrium dendrobatidis JAM81]|uniref:Chromatin modification-related protein EAF7 n=2 Tax=Batrachochytrium dendrobatidis TaxID=109871 RepID=F4PAZ2_BATDJ|nr:uncharacterized protein BATDEDRAFT_27474 [Batrachochytrium dendrobatidis JAM81]EGF77763.1 hypothetical protein BATDEDRAFT_27474 [Batrachochytrium dendrobatidis JAM81]KAK5666293.1 hypothetical protein QVD99_007054 [Batrachochytrium dendrobatidis]OAJ43146.1 hypothetical protein BDEG_26527 [Batrachochytrium dendrobatidis JEL423]|eukprot:XP_006681683.1 hypothetical protein BATDEDRAFT_27474 [Batrachochytrium dendrobatidis JAM81]
MREVLRGHATAVPAATVNNENTHLDHESATDPDTDGDTGIDSRMDSNRQVSNIGVRTRRRVNSDIEMSDDKSLAGTKNEDSASNSNKTTVWTPEMEMTLFQAVAKYRPIGVHKHFRILNVQRFINTHMGTDISIQELWNRLSIYYNIEKLDELADDTEADVPYERRIHRAIFPFTTLRDFTLPSEDFYELMDERRKAESSSTGSPEHLTIDTHSPIKTRTTRAHPYSPTTSSAFTGSPERHGDSIADHIPIAAAKLSDKSGVSTPAKSKLGRPRKAKMAESSSSVLHDMSVSADTSDIAGEPHTPQEPSRRSTRNPNIALPTKRRRG